MAQVRRVAFQHVHANVSVNGQDWADENVDDGERVIRNPTTNDQRQPISFRHGAKGPQAAGDSEGGAGAGIRQDRQGGAAAPEPTPRDRGPCRSAAGF